MTSSAATPPTTADLDNEAADLAKEIGIDYVRADTVGTDPRTRGRAGSLMSITCSVFVAVDVTNSVFVDACQPSP